MVFNYALEEVVNASQLFTGIMAGQFPAYLSFSNARFLKKMATRPCLIVMVDNIPKLFIRLM